MSDARSTGSSNVCDQFAEQLRGQGPRFDDSAWADHLGVCPSCREQVRAHEALLSVFGDHRGPELSFAFDAGLDRKIAAHDAASVPLTGWRLATMSAYTVTAVATLWWLIRDVRLSEAELSSPWTHIAVLAMVPLTFWLALIVSRWIPARDTPSDLA